MEENKSKKVNKNKMKIMLIGISIICIIIVIIVIIGVVITRNNIKTEISSNLEDTENVVEDTTVFEDIGRFRIAVAGNNNADRGTSQNVNVKLIANYPENWDEIKKNIPTNILSRINNMSGSRLDFNGKVKKAWLTTKIYGMSSIKKGDILIIKPDGKYEILYESTLQTIPINITESGWYYISFLDVPVQPHQAWAMIAIYENSNFSQKYVNLKCSIFSVKNGTPVKLYFTNKFKLKSKYELFGSFSGGLSGGWVRTGITEDKVEAILSDGTYKQLYQSTYNGKTIFAGRSSTDFVNGTFNTIRSHSIKGGELDVFYEELGKDYFDNKEVVGYRLTQIGSGNFASMLIGLSQEIYSPEFLFNNESSTNDIVENENIHIKTNITNSATDEESIGYDTKVVCKLDEALSEVQNIVVKINDNIVNVESVYNTETNEITINGIDEILPSQVVTIEYDVKVNSNIQNKGEVNSNVELPIVVNVQSYPIDINTLEETEQEKYRELYVEEENTVKVSGVYKKASGGIEVKYIDEVTNGEIETKEEKTGLQGDEYTTDSKEISGYGLVETPTNATGTMQEEKITVTYKYRKLSKVIVKYVDIISNSEINKEEVEYKEGDNYTVEPKEIDNYKLIETPENASGIVGRENIDVVYGYKKISEGVEVKYIDEVTGEEIGETETITGLEKDKYETESKEIEGYELVNTPANKIGEMRAEKITVTYKYRKLSKVTVKYIDLNSGEEIDREEKEYKEGENYTTKLKEMNKYRVVETPENARGVVRRENIEVIYGYKKIAGGVEVKYIDEVLREEIATAENQVGLEKDRYETESKEISEYELTVMPANARGEMTIEKITVEYEYRKLSKVTVKCIDLNSGEEIEKEEKEYKEGDSYITESKEINGYKLVEIPENVNGVVGREDIEVIYGYKKIAEGVEIKYIDEVTGEEIDIKETKTGLEKDKYETEAKEIEGYELVNTPTNKTGEMTVDKITVIYKYRKLSKVTVKYIDLNNNTEIDKEEKTYKEGDSYTTEAKEINNYKLVESPTNANGVVEREDIEVIYGYKKISGGVIVKHIDKETNVVIKEEKIEGLVGEKYSTRKLDLEKYNYIEVVGNIEGEFIEESIEVSYYYEKKQAIVEIIYEDENGKEIYKEIMEGKVGEKYKVEVKDIENYKIVEKPKNIEGIYGVDEIVVKFVVEKIKVKVEINIVDENGNIIEVIEKEGYIGDKEEIELPEISGYYTEEKSIFIEYGKENNINVMYKKKLLDLPNTSDINIYVYICIFVVSLSFISFLIIKKLNKLKK